MLLFRLIKLGEGRRVGGLVGAPVVRTDVRTVGLTARGGRRIAFKMTTGERERARERHIRVRKKHIRMDIAELDRDGEKIRASPRTHETVLMDESGITIDFLPGDSMHLTSITLFIRGDKQSVEKRRRGSAGRTFVPYETFIGHWQASRFSKISSSQRNAAKHASRAARGSAPTNT